MSQSRTSSPPPRFHLCYSLWPNRHSHLSPHTGGKMMEFSHLTPWAASITGQPSLNWNRTVGNKQGQLRRTDHQHMDKKMQRAVTGPPDASNPHPVSQEWLRQSCPYHWYRIVSELKGSAQDWGGRCLHLSTKVSAITSLQETAHDRFTSVAAVGGENADGY